MRRMTIALLILLIATLTVMPLSAEQAATPAQVRAIAKDAYIYGYPMVQAYLTMYAFSIDKNNPQYKGPFNAPLSFARVFTPDDSAFVTPNSDTPYTFLSLDLRSEPIVLTVPPVEKNRYWVFQMEDGMADGQKAIDDRRSSSGGDISSFFGTRAFLHNDYVARATGAQMGIGANSREEALYPLYEKDSSGQPLDGSK